MKYEYTYSRSDAIVWCDAVYYAALADSSVAVKRLEHAVLWLSHYRDAMLKEGVKINLREILGFDPWGALRVEQKRLAKGNTLLARIEQGEYSHPNQALTMSVRGLVDQYNRIEEQIGQINIIHELVEDTEFGKQNTDKIGLAYDTSFAELPPHTDWRLTCYPSEHQRHMETYGG